MLRIFVAVTRLWAAVLASRAANMKRAVILLAICSSFAGATRAEQKPTSASVTIHAPAEVVKSVLVTEYASNGWTIESDTPYQLTMVRAVDGIRGAFAQALLAPRICSGFTPQQFATFILTSMRGTTVLSSTYGVEMTQGLACTRSRTTVALGKKELAGVQACLDRIRAASEKLAEGPVTSAPAPAAQAPAAPVAPAPPVAAPVPAPPVAQPQATAPAMQVMNPSDTTSVAEAARANRARKARQQQAANPQ